MKSSMVCAFFRLLPDLDSMARVGDQIFEPFFYDEVQWHGFGLIDLQIELDAMADD